MRWPPPTPQRRAGDHAPRWFAGELFAQLAPWMGWAIVAVWAWTGKSVAIIDGRVLFKWSLRLSAALWLLPVLYRLALRRRRFLDMSGLAFFALMWGCAVLPWGFLILTSLDRQLDLRPPARVMARVVSKDAERRGLTAGELTLALPDGETVSLRAGEDLFSRATEGKTVALEVKPGAFGWRWVADARLP